jgi:hypothetical protein
LSKELSKNPFFFLPPFKMICTPVHTLYIIETNDAIISVCRLALRAANALLNPIVTEEAEKEVPVAHDTSNSSWLTELMEDDADDPAMVVEYEDEIFSYMRELEVSPILPQPVTHSVC